AQAVGLPSPALNLFAGTAQSGQPRGLQTRSPKTM
ncbi:hypothetical protein Cadr_000031213, partial [Camelus dromedarius]